MLLEATNNWCVNINKSLLNEVILINLKKAFDMISHEIVLQKLVKMASTKILSARSHPTYPLGINNVVSIAIYPPIVKLIVGLHKVL